MTQEKLHICEVTLQDMYALLKLSKELSHYMAQQLDYDNTTARDYMNIVAYMCECVTMPLFNCAGALGVNLVSWTSEYDKVKGAK